MRKDGNLSPLLAGYNANEMLVQSSIQDLADASGWWLRRPSDEAATIGRPYPARRCKYARFTLPANLE